MVLRGSAAATAVLVHHDQELRRVSRVPQEVLAAARAVAHAEGYATGWAQGRQEAAAAVHVEAARAEREHRTAERAHADLIAQALTALDIAATGLAERCAPALADAGDAVAAIAFAVIEALFAHELAAAADPALDAVRRALSATPAGRPVLIRLHPADHAAIAGSAAADAAGDQGRMVNFVADHTVAPGDAVAESDAVTVDAGLHAALARVREVLGG
ncbi:MAG: flagellar assembly protein FliH [Pseudonocardiales bacterium]|nr:MAG: flagellar assembly protein FliH [Pseudonocardiales bacterium]